MHSGSDARSSSTPVMLPLLRASRSLSDSTPREPDGRTVAVVPSASPPRLNMTASDTAQHTVDGHDDPVLVSLAQSDLSVARSVAESYYFQYRDSVAENAQLRATLQQLESDSVQVVQFLEGKLKEVQTEAMAYKSGTAQLLENHRAAEESLQLKYGDMVRERDAELAHYATVTAKLHDDLQQASRYVQQRQEHATELQQLQEQLAELVAAHEKELAALQFQTMDRKLKLIALEKTMRAEFDELVETRAATALEERFQSVLERTRSLESEKLVLTRNVQDLMKLASQLDAERLQVRREAAVQQQAQRELQSRALARGRLREQADLKTHQLEERLREAAERHKEQMAQVEARYAARVSALEDELTATRHSLQSHRAELQQMRQLAAKVVGERSDLEDFFHTALADCQRYRHAMAMAGSQNSTRMTEKVEWGNSGGAAATTTTLATSTLSGGAGATTLKDNGAHFEELSWKDKEKVIKSLLFFINANYYKNSPVPEGDTKPNK